MMVNIPEWQKQNITKRPFPTEGTKNVFWVKARISSTLSLMGQCFLPSIYNEFGGGEDDPQQKGTIIHWTGRRKPWQMVLSDYDAQWRSYNAASSVGDLERLFCILKPENYQ